MTKKIRLGFVGCGFVAQQVHLPCFASNSRFCITHLSDPYEDMRTQIATRYGIENQFDSHKSLLSQSELDAVVVTLPRKLTFHVVRDLVLAGKYILAEKPICLNSIYGNSLLEELASNRHSVMTAYMKQHDLGFLEFKRRIRKISLKDIISIRGYCFMGNSYANPLGDIKGTQLADIDYQIQEFPGWLPSHLNKSFEQFINVFSHLTHALEVAFDSQLVLEHVNINKDGEGLVFCSISSIPVCLELIRGVQNQWREGIVVNTRSSQFELCFPPAFLRNVPATLKSTSGKQETIHESFMPEWSWSFQHQTDAFARFIDSGGDSHRDLQRAVRQVSFIEQIFKLAFSL